jgi:hypothetical protein
MSESRTAPRVSGILLLLVATALGIVGKQKPTQVYPENGTVLAMRMESTVRSNAVYTDSQGRTHGGRARTFHHPVYKIRGKQIDYEVEGGSFAIGDMVNFRIEKDKLYIKRGDKEQKLSIVAAEQRDAED